MKMKTSLLTLTAVAGLLLAQTVLTAQTAPTKDAVVSADTISGITLPALSDLKATYAALKLTSAQKAQLSALVVKYKSTVNYQVNLVVQERRKLRSIINTVPTNESAVRGQSSVVAGAETELAVTRAKISSDVQGILTPEQIAQVRSVQAKIYGFIDTLLVRIRTFFASL